MLTIVGIAVMVLGIAVVASARLYPARRPSLERWGGNVFLIGLVVWVLRFVVRFAI